jgi:hypothetical protein
MLFLYIIYFRFPLSFPHLMLMWLQTRNFLYTCNPFISAEMSVILQRFDFDFWRHVMILIFFVVCVSRFIFLAITECDLFGNKNCT